MQDRNSGIDVLRGLAILLVLEQHLLWWPFFKLVLDAPPLVIGILQYGWAGVDLFFVVSAYLLTANLLRHRGETHLVALFYARRALRILPLYWLLLLVGFATRHWWLSSGGSESFWLWRNPQPLHHYLLFMQNWARSGRPGPGPEFFGPTWSLAAEEHFYFLLPLLLAWLKPRQLGWFAASLILVSPFLRVAITDGAGPLAGAFWTIAHLDAFAWGVLIALVSQFRPHLLTLASARFYGGWGAAIITSAIFLAPGARGTPLGVTLVALGGALALLAAVRPSGLKSPAPGLLTRGLAWCGKRCYSLYLFHFPIMGLTYVAAGGLNPLEETHASATLVALSLVLVFAFADLSYRVAEKPLMAMANRLTPYVRKKRQALPEA